MAKRAGPRRARKTAPAVSATPRPREQIIEALLSLLAERDFGEIGLADVAERAGVSLAVLRENYDGKIAIIADWSRRTDIAVLEGGAASEEGEARDRLFDVLMRRFDALQPHKQALRRLARAAQRDLGLACALERILVRSQKWMLVAAGIHKSGLSGTIAIRGTECVYLETMRTWLDDDDPGLARTMAALDRALRRGERGMRLLDDLCGWVPRFRSRSRRRGGRGDEARVEA